MVADRPDGLVGELTVFFRPLATLQLIAEVIGGHMERRFGLLISYLTGSLVRVEYGPKIPEHQAKLDAEQTIERSGVPYTFGAHVLHEHVVPSRPRPRDRRARPPTL